MACRVLVRNGVPLTRKGRGLMKRAEEKLLDAFDWRRNYALYLQTPHWENVRKDMLTRAKYRCSECGRETLNLEVHHLTYERLGHELRSDLAVLCDGCHAALHETRRNRRSNPAAHPQKGRRADQCSDVKPEKGDGTAQSKTAAVTAAYSDMGGSDRKRLAPVGLQPVR